MFKTMKRFIYEKWYCGAGEMAKLLTEQSVRAEDLSSVPSLVQGGLQPPVTPASRESYASALFKHMHLCVYNHTYRHIIESKIKGKEGGKGDRR